MTLTEQLEPLLAQLQSHLTSLNDHLLNDLKRIQTDQFLIYDDAYVFSDIVSFYFEYEYDYLDIIGWATDKQQNIITNTFLLPSKKDIDRSNDRWNYLLPGIIYDNQFYLMDQYDDEEDEWDEYQNQKGFILRTWFRNHWLKVSAETGLTANAYFSIHDTFWRTDLNSGEKLNDDEIADRYKMN